MINTIAIVEDNASIAQFISEALSDEGYTVRVFGDGRSALAAILAHPPGLVLLDLDLPIMNGVEVLLRLRGQFGGDLPIVIMTASSQRHILVPHGATAFLSKPFNLDGLLACVARHITLIE